MSRRLNGKVMVRKPRQNSNKRVLVRTPGIPHPPPLQNYAVTYSRTLRWSTNAATVTQVTYQNLLDTILYSTTTVVPYDLFYMVRVRRVRLWAIAAVGTPTTITLCFDGATAGSVGDQKIHTDTSMGLEPAYVSASPARNSLASKFQISSTAVAFIMDLSSGTVVDVSLDFHSDVIGSQKQAQNNSVASTVGQLAFRGLDGLALATTKYLCPDMVIQI